MFNRLNFEVLMQMIIELFFSAIISVGLITGRIHLLLHPKFDVFLWMSVAFLILMALFSSYKLMHARHMNILTRYFYLLLPLLVLLLIPVGDISSVYGGYSTKAANTSQPESNISLEQMIPLNERYHRNSDGYIDIDDESYLKWYLDMTFKWNEFKGENFKFLSTVFRPEDSEDFVVIGRLGMICCMADLQPCGFIYNGKGYENLKNGEWIYVTGKIKENKKYTYNYEQLPMIYDVKIEKAKKPIDQYVYIN